MDKISVNAAIARKPNVWILLYIRTSSISNNHAYSIITFYWNYAPKTVCKPFKFNFILAYYNGGEYDLICLLYQQNSRINIKRKLILER